MSYLPVLKGKTQSQFTNPLAGFVYDNKKYADSCLEDDAALPHRVSAKSKSAANSFLKQSAGKALAFPSQPNSDKQLRLHKIMSLSKRLSNSNKFRCTRNKWFSEEEVASAELPHNSRAFEKTATKYPREAEAKPFKFPEIKALILTLYHSSQDADKACRLNFKNYFEMFFKETLSGIIFRELIEMVEKHIKSLLIMESEVKEESEVREGVEAEFTTILTKQELYCKLR